MFFLFLIFKVVAQRKGLAWSKGKCALIKSPECVKVRTACLEFNVYAKRKKPVGLYKSNTKCGMKYWTYLQIGKLELCSNMVFR